MQRIIAVGLSRTARVISLTLLAVLGTIALTRFAPGYFSDEREMDGQYAEQARSDISVRESQESSFFATVALAMRSKGLGMSHQFGVPVSDLLKERSGLTAKLMVEGLTLGWMTAFALALVLCSRRTQMGEGVITLSSSALLCLPVAVMAAVCLITDWGGPVFVLSALIAAREFKLVYRLLRMETRDPQILYARAQGYRRTRLLHVHILRNLWKELLALVMTSLVVALSAVVPVEVIFDKAGLGQLAWSAAMNRDLPVLIAVTLVMSTLVGVASLFVDACASPEAQCA